MSSCTKRSPQRRSSRGGRRDACQLDAHVAMVRAAGERIAIGDVGYLVAVGTEELATLAHAVAVLDAEAVGHPQMSLAELGIDGRGKLDRSAPSRDAHDVALADAEPLRIGRRDVELAVRPASFAPRGVALDGVG